MKRVVRTKRTRRYLELLCIGLAGLGLSSYVILVSVLIQKDRSDLGSVAQAALERSTAEAYSRVASVRNQQTRFVAEIIRAHNPQHGSTESLARLIVEESAKAKVDPFFVAAVVRSESMFKQSAISPRGAKGLMQLMPETSRYVSKRENIALSSERALHDPATNLRLGIAYLKYLDKMFNGNRERMLIAYNWGPGNVKLAIRGNARTPSESVQYAKKILSAHREWKARFSTLAATIGYDTTALG